MSTTHRLDSEGAVVCGASPREDGANVTSNPELVSCEEGCKVFLFETMPDTYLTTVKSGKYGPYNQVKREVKTRWVLNPEAEGVPKVVVDLTTNHYGDRKQFSTSLTWATVEQVQKHRADGPGVLAIESWGSDHLFVRVFTAPVARYSVKAMEAHHAVALAAVEEQWESAKAVFEEAVKRTGLAEMEA